MLSTWWNDEENVGHICPDEILLNDEILLQAGTSLRHMAHSQVQPLRELRMYVFRLCN